MDILGREIPVGWIEALTTIQQHFPEAVIAGGALRDLVFGGTVKDIDIFAPDNCPAIEGLLSSTGWGFRAANEHLAEYAQWAGSTISFVGELIVPELDHPINLILLNMNEFSMSAVLGRMDIGACKAGTDGRLVTVTCDFLRDAANRSFTVVYVPNATAASATLTRMERFRHRWGSAATYDTALAEAWL